MYIIIENIEHIQLEYPHCEVFTLEGSKSMTQNELYKEIAKILSFPSYFGENWDALYDMLDDLSWLNTEKIVLYILNYDTLLSQENKGNRLKIFSLLLAVSNPKLLIVFEKSDTLANDIQLVSGG